MEPFLVVETKKSKNLSVVRREWLLNVGPKLKVGFKEDYTCYLSSDLSENLPINDKNDRVETVKVLK